MPRKGLTREEIVGAAAALAEQKGAENLTLRELADAGGGTTPEGGGEPPDARGVAPR